MKYQYRAVGKKESNVGHWSHEFDTAYEALGEIDNQFQRAVPTKTVAEAVAEIAKQRYSYAYETPDVNFIVVSVPEYIITGVNLNGKRFKIETTNPQNYKISKGTLWVKTETGKRKVRTLCMEAATPGNLRRFAIS